MGSKLDKLKELGELYKSGAITEDEFSSLKQEIIQQEETKSAASNKTSEPEKEPGKNKQQVRLTSFRDKDNKHVSAPKIEFIDFNNISDGERQTLRNFLRKKQISASHQMTQDEIDLGHVLFTHSEIVSMNERRAYYYGKSNRKRNGSILLIAGSLVLIVMFKFMKNSNDDSPSYDTDYNDSYESSPSESSGSDYYDCQKHKKFFFEGKCTSCELEKEINKPGGFLDRTRSL